jgi:hypothetical protein
MWVWEDGEEKGCGEWDVSAKLITSLVEQIYSFVEFHGSNNSNK